MPELAWVVGPPSLPAGSSFPLSQVARDLSSESRPFLQMDAPTSEEIGAGEITLHNHVYFLSWLYGDENHLPDGVETPTF